MGTFAEIAVSHGDADYAQAAIQAALDQLQRVEDRLTWFRSDSEVGRVNRDAARGVVPVSSQTLAVLEEALRWAIGTDGAFDPCLGRATALWDVGNRTIPPPEHLVHDLAGRRLFRHLVLDQWRGQPMVSFEDPDVALDLGGIGKGYGVDRAVATLRDWGIQNALVNVGGDLYAMGVSPDESEWEVGVRSPDDPRKLAAILRVSDRAIATSGNYEQYFEHRGHHYHHLLDPRTGAPRQAPNRSLTVSADACTTADAAATAAFGQARGEAQRLIWSRAPDAEIVHLA
jgi:thiamine biosynthesis lipoprotein